MFVLGLTGSIGMGKSTTAKFFAEEGVPVHDSDAVVHRLYDGEAVPAIEAAFPGTTVDGKVDRNRLAAHVVAHPADFKKLEALVHPLVRAAEQRFLAAAENDGAKVAVLDIPLLYETAAEARCDAVVVVSAPADMQRARALERGGMTDERFEAIVARQVPDAVKRERADFVVDSSLGFDHARAQVREILRAVATMPKRVRKPSPHPGRACARPGAGSWGRGWRALSLAKCEPGEGSATTPHPVPLEPSQGHRVVEIGCIELINRIPTGASFHRYLNPERDMPAEAFNVHGLSDEFLKDKPLFADVCDELLAFLGDATLVAHNAPFDYGFLCAELDRCKREALTRDRVIDTIALARRKHSAGPYSLDALCARYGIDSARRTRHGALLDAELLAEVYLELIGARQASLILVDIPGGMNGKRAAAPQRPIALPVRISEADIAAHRDFVATLGDSPLWRQYLPG